MGSPHTVAIQGAGFRGPSAAESGEPPKPMQKTYEFSSTQREAFCPTFLWLVGQGHPSEKYESQLGWL